MKKPNRPPSLEMASMAPSNKAHRYKGIIEPQHDLLLWPHPTQRYTQSKRYLHTIINGQLKHAAQASQISRLGITEMVRVNCSASICLMTVVKFVQPGSITNVRCSTIFSKREMSIISQVHVVFRSPKSNSQI